MRPHSPVVAPLDEGARLEGVGPHLVDVRLPPLRRLRPVVERQAHLALAPHDQRPDPALELAVRRVRVQLVEGGRVLAVVLVPEQVH